MVSHAPAPSGPSAFCAWSATLPPTPASPHPTPVGANRSTSRRFWKLHGKTYPVNVGTTFGTRDALATLLERIFDALRPGLASTSTRAAAQLLPRGAEAGIAEGCWEQGVLNVLAYTVAASAQPRAWASCVKDGLPARSVATITVWDYLTGPVKTLTIGARRDRFGRFYNERGAMYAIVHQFKKGRNSPFFGELARMLPANGSAFREPIFAREMQRVRHLNAGSGCTKPTNKDGSKVSQADARWTASCQDLEEIPPPGEFDPSGDPSATKAWWVNLLNWLYGGQPWSSRTVMQTTSDGESDWWAPQQPPYTPAARVHPPGHVGGRIEGDTHNARAWRELHRAGFVC